MNDDAAALCHHRGHELAVKPDGGHQVEVELLGPLRVAQRRGAARRGGRPAEHVNDDIDPPRRSRRVAAALLRIEEDHGGGLRQ